MLCKSPGIFTIAIQGLLCTWLAGCSGGESPPYDPGETTAARCQDGMDNDDDGAIDCQDTDCTGFLFCLPPTEDTASACADGEDNDGDGAIDCDDGDCQDFLACLRQESTAAMCQDAMDNDDDGTIDCDDADCRGYLFCASEEVSAPACQDGRDNDGDGAIDCADGDCAMYVFCTGTGEVTVAACGDGLDNDSDGAIDCEDADCMSLSHCLDTNGFPLADQWGEIWDGLPRGAATFAEARDTCDAIGARLPTATELFRNNAETGSGNLADANATVDLWTFLRRQTEGQRVAVRLSDGDVSYVAETKLLQYRCVWPDSPGEGFDSDRCYGPPGQECHQVDLLHNVDTLDRPALDYVAAAEECSFYGASIPMTAEWGEMIHAGLPNGSDKRLWAGNATYWYDGGGSYGVPIISWKDENATRWGYNYGAHMGWVSKTSSDQRFRCIGLVSHALVGLPDAPACNGECYSLSARRSPLIADSEDRAALSWAEAEQTCRGLGAVLPNQAEFSELVRSGWPNGSNEWLWFGEPTAWFDGTFSYYGIPLGRWTGMGPANWTYRTGHGGHGGTTAARQYRCVWRSKGADLPVCAADEVLVQQPDGYQCTAYAPGYSGGNANPDGMQFVDCHGNAWDTAERDAATFADAEQTCTAKGGRLPTASEIYAVRATATTCAPIGDTTNTNELWTGTYSSKAGYRITVKVSDGAAAATAQGDTTPFRCIWPATLGDVLSGPSCHGPDTGYCFQAGNLIADAEDRVAVSMPAAIQECAAAGGHVPDLNEFVQLIHAGWPNGSDSWLWIAESMYKSNGIYGYTYGYAVGRWPGTGTTAWQYQHSEMGSLSSYASLRNFRCVYTTVTR